MANLRTRLNLSNLHTRPGFWTPVMPPVEYKTAHLEALPGPLTNCLDEKRFEQRQHRHRPPPGNDIWDLLNATGGNLSLRIANEVEYSASLNVRSTGEEIPLQIDPHLKMNLDYMCFRRIIIRSRVQAALKNDTVTFLTEAEHDNNAHPIPVMFRVDTDIAMPEYIDQVNIKLRLMRTYINAHGQTFIMSGAAEINQTLPDNISTRAVLSAACDVRLIVCWFVTVPIRGNWIKFRIAIRTSELPDVKSPPDYSINIECEEAISFDEFKLMYFALAWYYNAQLEPQTANREPASQSELPAVPILVPVYRAPAVHRRHCESIRDRLSDFQYNALLAMRHVPLDPQLHQLSDWLTETLLLPKISPTGSDGN